MAYKSYKGTISGTGDSITRLNEITGDDLAMFRHFVIGYESGVLKYDNHDFDYSVDGNTINITDGMCFAYGYFGYSKAKGFLILPPAVEQYYVIYARLDKSVIPNGFDLFIKNNYSSPNIGINSFRKDVLSTIKTGVYEIPLWLFRVTNEGVDELSFKDLRPNRVMPSGNKTLLDCIKKVKYSDYATLVSNTIDASGETIYGRIEDGVTAATQPIMDNSEKVATTAFVQAAVQAEINK